MFDLDFTQVVQTRLPFRVLAEIFCNPLREQDVPRISTRHDPFRDLDGSSGNVGSVIDIGGDLGLPAALRHAGHVAVVRQLAQADPAQAELAVDRTRAAALAAPGVVADLVLAAARLAHAL